MKIELILHLSLSLGETVYVNDKNKVMLCGSAVKTILGCTPDLVCLSISDKRFPRARKAYLNSKYKVSRFASEDLDRLLRGDRESVYLYSFLVDEIISLNAGDYFWFKLEIYEA